MKPYTFTAEYENSVISSTIVVKLFYCKGFICMYKSRILFGNRKLDQNREKVNKFVSEGVLF